MNRVPPPQACWPSLRRVLLLAAALLCSYGNAAQGSEPLTLTRAEGNVEVQTPSNAWAIQNTPTPITTALRTGTGRALLNATPNGTLLVGSTSQIRRFKDEADLLSGRFLLRGPIAVHVQGNHLVMDAPGQVRVDLQGLTRRVAVISGNVRLALGDRVHDLNPGQQLNLKTSAVQTFKENDPWYDAQFRGVGIASVEATRGLVRITQGQSVRNALIGDELQPGMNLQTDANAWAEVGFSGGGYLRLNAQSELSVLSIERTSLGREVLLKLAKGTAWNVVEKGQGGYRIDTPVVSTAVRGTTFRVDADGLVKVFDGQVEVPSNDDLALSAGQQRSREGQVGTLQLDDLDRLNIALDAERARPLTLALDPSPRSVSALNLAIRSLPDARITAQVAGRTIPLTAQGNTFPLQDLTSTLPEGLHTVQISAVRYGQTLTVQRTVLIDRTPPTLNNLTLKRQGRLMILSGQAHDNLSSVITVTVQVGQAQYTHAVTLRRDPAFTWLILNTDSALPVQLTASDTAGNQTHAQIP